MTEMMGFSSFEAFSGSFVALMALCSVFSAGFGLVAYILRSLGYFTIARRRQLRYAWMGWVPLLNYYVLGCISDQFQYVTRGRDKSKRKSLLVLGILHGVLDVLLLVFYWLLLSGLWLSLDSTASPELAMRVMTQNLTVQLLGFLAVALALAGVSIALLILRYIALFDLYTSCDPNNAVLFLVLGIFFPITEPFFIVFSRNKDRGMPPRKAAQPPL